VERLHGVLSIRALRRLPLRALPDHPDSPLSPDLDTRCSRRRRHCGASRATGRILEARWGRGSRGADFLDADQQRGPALHRARRNRPDLAGALCEALPGHLALPPLCAVQLRFTDRAAVLSIRPGTLGFGVGGVNALVGWIRDRGRLGSGMCVAVRFARQRRGSTRWQGGRRTPSTGENASGCRAAHRVAAPAGLRGRPADGRDEPLMPRRLERTAALGRAARALPVDLHFLLRVGAQPPAASVHGGGPDRAARRCSAEIRQRRTLVTPVPDRCRLRSGPHLDRAPFRKLHAAARNAPAPETTGRADHRLLPLDLRRGCTGWPFRRPTGTNPLRRLRRAAAWIVDLLGRARCAGLASEWAAWTHNGQPPHVRCGGSDPRASQRHSPGLRRGARLRRKAVPAAELFWRAAGTRAISDSSNTRSRGSCRCPTSDP